MRTVSQNFWDFLDEPLRGRGRILLAVLVVPLLLSFLFPLWRISMKAPQYPNGLSMDIYSYQLIGGNDGHDIQEINTLNHYIGMHTIDRAALSDLDWLPFAFGALALLALRVALVGNVRSLIDLVIITTYVAGFGMFRFYYKMYVFGHELDPKAPVKVAPFMPALLGSKQIANFTTHAGPQAGTYLVTLFATTATALMLWHLYVGHRNARRLKAGTAA